MIRYIPNPLIDKDKYDLCVSGAKNSRVYAYSWYLNCVCENWDVIVSEDYDMVMPLPRRKKYGIHYIHSPSWTQQLGIFSKKEITEDTVLEFMRRIPRKFLLIDYRFNAANPLTLKSRHQRINYILTLNRGLEHLFKGFNKNRRRISRLNFDDFNLEKQGSPADFLELYESVEKNYTLEKNALESLKKLSFVKNDCVKIWNIYKNGIIVAGLLWTLTPQRITYLAPVVKKEFKKDHLHTFMINELIRTYQHSDLILDFEGSMIPGVAKYYQSFGAVEEPYYLIKKRCFAYV